MNNDQVNYLSKELMGGQSALVIIDADCIICSASANWLEQHDRKKRLWFSTIQSLRKVDRESLQMLPPKIKDTMYLFYRGHFYERSEAVIRAVALTDSLAKFVILLLIIPRFIRNTFYDFFAANRHFFSNKKKTCTINPPVRFSERLLSTDELMDVLSKTEILLAHDW